MRPLVAITSTMLAEAGPYRRNQVALYALYVEVLERHGLASYLLTQAHDRSSIEAILDRCNGLVLSGGEDIEPERYGEERREGLGMTNPARDEMELEALTLALERELPILGICRGCQLINVYLGGTLYQDLTLEKPSPVRHLQEEPWEVRTHRVSVEPDSRLAEIVVSDNLVINSFHHQGVKELATGLRDVAHAADGTIEAIEWDDDSKPWLLGVQWHPERHEATAPVTDSDRRIFEAFGREVEARARDG